MKKIKLFLITLIIAFSLTLSGCSTTVQNAPIIEQQSLLQKCTTDTPLPTNFELDENGNKVYTGKELYNTLRDWQDVYNTCASTHNKLVDTINDLENMKKIPKK